MDNNARVFIIISDEDSELKSRLPKILHRVCGIEMLAYTLRAARQVSNEPMIIIDESSNSIKEYFINNDTISLSSKTIIVSKSNFVANDSTDLLASNNEYVIIMAGDAPLIRPSTLEYIISYTQANSLDGVYLSDNSYRSIESDDVISKDNIFYSAVYCFRRDAFVYAKEQLGDNCGLKSIPSKLLSILKDSGKNVGAYKTKDNSEIFIVENRADLAYAEMLMRQRINKVHMKKGVTLIDPNNTYIGLDVTIGNDTIIYPGNILEGNTSIGDDCILYPNNRLRDTTIGNSVCIESSVILSSRVDNDTNIGPCAYIRPGSNIGSHVKIGDFVEIKNSTIGNGTKVSHLAYIGDAEIGQRVNVGCGAVCVNYDGKKKHKTIVGDNAFIGCNANLVAPVEIEDDSFVAAGSTITHNVPSKALAIARARQINKEGWVDKKSE